MKVFKFFLFFFIVRFHLADYRPYVIDVIRKCNATESFYEDQ